VGLIGSSRAVLAAMPFDPVHDLMCPHGTGLPGDFKSIPEQNEGRDAANGVAFAECRFSLGIHLGQSGAWFQPFRDLLELGRHHFARSTPGRPKVDENRQVSPSNVSIEISSAQGQGMSGKQGMMTLPASGSLIEFGGRQPIDGVAVWTDDMEHLRHGLLRSGGCWSLVVALIHRKQYPGAEARPGALLISHGIQVIARPE